MSEGLTTASVSQVSDNLVTAGSGIDTDLDNDPLTVQGVGTGDQHLLTLNNANVGTSVNGNYGSIDIASNGAYTYTLDNTRADIQALATGEHPALAEVFTYTINDGHGGTSTALVTVTITGTNDVPLVAVSDVTGAVTEMLIPAGNLTDSGAIAFTDVDLTDIHTITTAPVGSTLGTLTALKNTDTTGTGSGGQLTWTYTVAASAVEYLAAGQTKLEQFTVTVNDGHGGVVDRTVNVTITGTNDVPLAVSDSLTVGKDSGTTSANLASNDTPSGDGGNVWTPVGPGASHGTAAVNTDGSYTYTPNANYSGPDSFDYKITDANGDFSSATVSITVTAPTPPPPPPPPVNHVPVAVDDSFSTPINTALSGSVSGNDTPSADGGNVWTLTGGASHGTAVLGSSGSYSYTPTTGYTGADSFSYTITDVDGSKSAATVSITVTDKDEPLAVSDSLTVAESSGATSANLATNDIPSGDSVNVWTLTTGALHGTAVVHPDGSYTYKPDAGFNGTDAFSYTITDVDNDGDHSSAIVSIKVIAAPVVVAPVVVVSEIVSPNTPLQISNFSPPLGGDQAPDPNVFFAGNSADRVVRVPVPLNLAVFVNNVVENFQKDRAASDSVLFSNPGAVSHSDIQSQSIGTGLGTDISLHVQYAVRASRAQAEVLDNEVNGRLSRINLSSDRMLPAPELFQSDTPQFIPALPIADLGLDPHRSAASDTQSETDFVHDKLVANRDKPATPRRTAPSFSEQLRGVGARTSVANRDTHRTRAITS